NAIKYSGEQPVINIQMRETDKLISIAIKDNGEGISPEYQKMLFNKFYRVPKGNVHNVKGFGLGLNYVNIIVKAHGGEVVCSSKAGEGSTFTIKLKKNKHIS